MSVYPSEKNIYAEDRCCASPRNQAVALGFMCLIHYAAMSYYACVLGYSKWNKGLDLIDDYVAYMPVWLLFHKMSRDVFLSSTDPDISHLFSCLKHYYSPQANMPIKPDYTQGVALLNHYNKMMSSPYCREEKTTLETCFKKAKHSNIFPSNTDLEKAIINDKITALYTASIIRENSPLKEEMKSLNIEINTPRLEALIKTQNHIDLCVYYCTRSLSLGNKAHHGKTLFSISFINFKKGNDLYIENCITGISNKADLYCLPHQDIVPYSWNRATGSWSAQLERIADGKGNQRFITWNVSELLDSDVKKPHLDSNQIRLLSGQTAVKKELRDLRTALPSQAILIIDYFTRHMDLLEDRDYQFYMLLSLFQPSIIDLAIEHRADMIPAIQNLYQKGVALGDLAQNAEYLTHRGLFLLKIMSWAYGYIVSCKTASTAIKNAARKHYDKLDQDIQFWLMHDKRQAMQTELQRIAFYNIMKRYSPADLSLPKNSDYLTRALYARFYIQQHSQDRMPGTITQAEDESFEPLFLTMQNIDARAIDTMLPTVLQQLLPDQAPFVSHPSAHDKLTDAAYYCLDKNEQSICVNLMDGDISLENQEFVHIPTPITRNHTPYERIISVDAYPLAQKINEQEYQFYWQGEEYYLAPHGFFKKIKDQWYQYITDDFLPEYLRDPQHYAWVSQLGDYALIMQHHPSEADKLIYHWQNDTLFSHNPPGQVCFNGDVRGEILRSVASFEDTNLIEIILLNPPKENHYQFYLPRYQLYGHFNKETGVTLDYNNKTYYIRPHPSPLACGIMIGESKTSEPWQCLLLVPIQPFYTKKIISGSHYQLIHDIDRTTEKNKTLNLQAYATFHYDDMRKLSTTSSSSAEQLYLVYLYCARYEYEKAYTLLKKHPFQGTNTELTYLYWLCEKLPTILENQKGSVEPIVNTKLLAIKLTALGMLARVPEQPREEENSDEDFNQFMETLPEYIIKTYTQYHRLSNNLSDELRIPKHEVEYLANHVWLRSEKTNRTAQKEWEGLLNEMDLGDGEEMNDTEEKEVEEQINTIKAGEEQQKKGYLAYVHAKTERFSLEKEETVPFVMPQTTCYAQTLITPYWPIPEQETYWPLAHGYDVLSKSDATIMEPGKFYLECKSPYEITYNYVDSLGEEKNETIDNIDDIALEADKPLSVPALNILKERILKHAAELGHTRSIVGTLADLQQLIQQPLAEDIYQRACNQLSLGMSDDALFMHLKYYFRLILGNHTADDWSRIKLKDFCQRTIMACADLNERLRNPLEMTLDNRADRLQIAIVLLRGLEHPALFKEAYYKTIKQYSQGNKDLEKYSIWNMISNKSDGFYSKFPMNTLMQPIPLMIPVHAQKTIAIKKKIARQKLLKRHALREHEQDQTSLKLQELPSTLIDITQKLQTHSQQRITQKSNLIKQYKALPVIEQRAKYDETDLALDDMEAWYRDAITSTIQECLDLQGSKDDVKHTLVRMTEELVHNHTILKRYATLLPTDSQALFSLKIKELGAKQLPLQLDFLLKKYALGVDDDFLNLRQLPEASQPLVRRTLKQWLRNVFLYRQYNRILETLQNLNKQNTADKQDELHWQLGKLILELQPLKGNAALDLFQYQTTKTVRSDQWALIESLIQKWDSASSNRVGQLIMGGGKSKVILPILAFLKADGYHLSTIEVPSPLLQTTYQDLQQTAKEVFDQELETFPFDRNTPADPVSLMTYLAKFKDIIQQKKCLIMAPSSLQSLHLKWKELLYQAVFDQDNPEIHEQIDLLSEILELFHERADVVIDEIHKVLNINLELNYSIGKKTSLDPILIKATLDLFDFLESVIIDVDEDHILSKLNGTPFLDILNNPEVLNYPSELMTKLMAYYAERYKAEHSFQEHPEPAKIQALLKAQWNVFLPLTLKQKLREQYGPSPEDGIYIAIPFAANNVPTENLFANFLESLNYTTQMSRIEGIHFDVFKTVLKSWKKSDQEYLTSNTDGASEAEDRYLTCIQAMMNQADLPPHLQFIDVANEEQLQAIYPYFKKNKSFIRYALEEVILPSIQLHSQKLTSNAINHANQVKRLQGLSGTLDSYPTFDNRITFDVTTSFGTKNYLKTLLKNKETPMLVEGGEMAAELSAIIDVGAHRRGKSNAEVAKELAVQLEHTDFRYVLFFQDDQLCAWKIGGVAQDVIALPSTQPDKIKQRLTVGPDQCFSYYDQSHATGIDLPQSPTACAGVSVDVTTTLSHFLQAVARMRQLSAGQTIRVFLSPALKNKLGENPTLDNLYQCLENTEKNQLANDVFKAACKKLYNVVQMDLEQRLRRLKARKSIALFKEFQHLLVDRNPDDIIELYANDITEQKTNIILKQISDAVLKQWQEATSNKTIDPKLRERCYAIIQDALIYCNETQQTTLELGTEVNIEQQQEVQIELKTEVETEVIEETLKPNKICTHWAKHCLLHGDRAFMGDDRDKSELTLLWQNHPENVKKYPTVEWSKELSVSRQFYITHDRQAPNILAKDCSLKPSLSTLFWKQGETIHALLICQEEAEVLVHSIKARARFSHASDSSFWLETTLGFSIVGTRPEDIETNADYMALKEQIYTLGGEAPLLAIKKELVWFSHDHLALLQDQMLQQGKTSYSTTFKQLEKRLEMKVSVINSPDRDESKSDESELTEPVVIGDRDGSGERMTETELTPQDDPIITTASVIDLPLSNDNSHGSDEPRTPKESDDLVDIEQRIDQAQDIEQINVPASSEKRRHCVDHISIYLKWRQVFDTTITDIERNSSRLAPQSSEQKKAMENALTEATRILKAADQQWPLEQNGNLRIGTRIHDNDLLLTMAEIYSRAVLALKFEAARNSCSADNLQSVKGVMFRYHPKTPTGFLTEELPIDYSPDMHKLNITYIIAQSDSLKGSGIPWLKKLGICLGLLAVFILVAGGILAAIPSGGTSLLSVAAGLVALNALTALMSSVGLVGAAGALAFIVGRETVLVRSVRTMQDGLSNKERENAKEGLTALTAQNTGTEIHTSANFFAKHSIESKEPSVNSEHPEGATKKR